MPHVRTLHPPDDRLIRLQESGCAAEGKAAEPPFDRFFEHLRASGSRTGAAADDARSVKTARRAARSRTSGSGDEDQSNAANRTEPSSGAQKASRPDQATAGAQEAEGDPKGHDADRVEARDEEDGTTAEETSTDNRQADVKQAELLLAYLQQIRDGIACLGGPGGPAQTATPGNASAAPGTGEQSGVPTGAPPGGQGGVQAGLNAQVVSNIVQTGGRSAPLDGQGTPTGLTGDGNGPEQDQGPSTQSGNPGERPGVVGGKIIRMSTAPLSDGSEASSTGGEGANPARQRSLAMQVTREVARIFSEPGQGQTGSTSGAGPAPSAPAGAVPSWDSTATVSAQAVDQVLSASNADGRNPAAQSGKAPDAGLRAALTDTPADTNVNRIVQVLRAHVGQHTSQVSIQLDPPHLGQIRIDLTMRDDALSLGIQTETETGRQLVTSRLDELRAALQRHGIVVERANVQMREAVHEAPELRDQQPARNPNQDAPGHMADQPQDFQHRGGSAAGEDVPASSLPVEAVESADGATDGVDFPQTATESRVDMVA
jgi:hypothetical protein